MIWRNPMNRIVNDQVFGQMEYKHRWVKKEKLYFWGEEKELMIIAKAFSGKPIVDQQRSAYLEFKRCLFQISSKTETIVKEYVSKHLEEIRSWDETFQFSQLKSLYEIITPISVVFRNNGEVFLLCECVWEQESGIGIGIVPEYVVAVQEYFL